MNAKKFIQSLELQDPVAAYPAPRITRGHFSNAIKTLDSEQSFIADKTIVSFAAGISAQSQKDVLNCTLLAQMAANKKIGTEDKDSLKWYEEYIEVLSQLGWILEGGDINTYEAKGSIFKVENVVIDILVSAFGSSYIGLITKTLNALKSARESKKLIAFEINSNSVEKSCFQIAAANEKDGAIVIELGTFLLTSTSQIKQILFFDFSGEKTKLEYINRRATFNVDSFSTNRDTVSEMLQDKIGKYISKIDI